MKLYQNGQLNAERIDCIDILVLLLAFASAVIRMFLFISGRQAGSGQLAVVYILVAICSVLMYVKYNGKQISKGALFTVALLIIVSAGFIYTGLLYHTENAWYLSEFKAFFAMAGCVFLLMLLIHWSKKTAINIMAVLILDILLTITSFLALVRGNGLSHNGLVIDTSGFLYQNISYYAAECIGLNAFIIGEIKRVKKVPVILYILMIGLTLIQLFTCFMSGGRGGAVLAAVLIVYGVFVIYGFKHAYKVVLPILAGIILILFIFPRMISLFHIDIRGLNRILKLFESGVRDQGRALLFSKAIASFKEKPFLGHGIGSIFFLINSYSHNWISDLLAETGVVGLLISVIVLFLFIIKAQRMYNKGSLYRLLIIFFIYGFTMNQFSGYFWVNQSIWLPMACIFAANEKDSDLDDNCAISK